MINETHQATATPSLDEHRPICQSCGRGKLDLIDEWAASDLRSRRCHLSDAEVRRSRVRQAHIYLASVGPLWRRVPMPRTTLTEGLARRFCHAFAEETAGMTPGSWRMVDTIAGAWAFCSRNPQRLRTIVLAGNGCRSMTASPCSMPTGGNAR
jgi:hypothetical protein